MNKFCKNIIKSILLGGLVTFLFLFPLAWSDNDNDGILLFLGIAIISTMIFCTYIIIDVIKENSLK